MHDIQLAAAEEVDDLLSLFVLGELKRVFGEIVGPDDLADVEGEVREACGATDLS